MRILRTIGVISISLLSQLALGQDATSPITGAEIEAQVARELAAYANYDYELIASKKYGLDPGFGFRTITARPDFSNLPVAMIENSMKEFFDSLEYYILNVEEIQTSVHGDTGIAWGVHIEDFQIKGKEPERHRVRFTYAFQRNESGELYAILGHRDIQEFDEDGQYIP